MENFSFSEKDINFMKEAILQAKKAKEKGEVPIGCVIVKNNKIISHGHNDTEERENPIGHSEINAIIKASKALDSWRLSECTIYTTLEPCLMCAGAILNTLIKKVVYGAKNKDSGVLGSVVHVYDMDFIKNRPVVVAGVLEEECENLLKDFFIELRK